MAANRKTATPTPEAPEAPEAPTAPAPSPLARALSAALLAFDSKREVAEDGTAVITFKGVRRDPEGRPLAEDGTVWQAPAKGQKPAEGKGKGWMKETRSLSALTDAQIADLFETGESRKFNDYANSSVEKAADKTTGGMFANWFANILGVQGRASTGESSPAVESVESAVVKAFLGRQPESFVTAWKKVWTEGTTEKGRPKAKPAPRSLDALSALIAAMYGDKAPALWDRVEAKLKGEITALEAERARAKAEEGEGPDLVI